MCHLILSNLYHLDIFNPHFQVWKQEFWIASKRVRAHDLNSKYSDSRLSVTPLTTMTARVEQLLPGSFYLGG